MAKKKAGRSGDFNLSEEVRNILKENRKLSGREVLEAIQEKFPGQSINQGSCNVAFSNARRRLGIKKGRRAKAVRKPGATRKGRPAAKATPAVAVDMKLLTLASKYLAEAGSAQAAISALQQVAALQINK